jgi:ADP-L-glycero-D-manno-heptose 6-epimerase
MIVITGAAGFIGSNMIAKLNMEHFLDLVLVDDFSNDLKNKNIENKNFSEKVDRDQFFSWLEKNHQAVDFVFHLGARTNTAEFNKAIFDKLNLGYSKLMWEACSQHNIPLLYASSAATYGLGELGYSDDHNLIGQLKPLNPYGESKNEFDKWVLQQGNHPPFWAGLKFFNVYGPNEYHKNRMASVIFHAYNQIKDSGQMVLFRSHKEGIKDGEQKRDFIYVKDLVDVLFFFFETQASSAIYNLGTGRARTFLDLVRATFHSIGVKEKIQFVDTPEDIRDKYQYFTQADMKKLNEAGYNIPFSSLEQGIDDYVKYFLLQNRYI